MAKCNHCGRELDPLIDYDGAELIIDREKIETDLCVDCFGELKRIIKIYIKQMESRRKKEWRV